MYKILTFNHHQHYLSLLAQTGHAFEVVIQYGSLSLPWLQDRAPCPSNLKLVEWGEGVKKKLRQGDYDFVLCHTVENLIWMLPYRQTSFVFMEHIPLFRYSLKLAVKSLAKRAVLYFFSKTHVLQLVSGSSFKAQSWKFKNTVVIEPAVLSFPPIYNDSEPKIVMVGNHFKERGRELGWHMVASLQSQLPLTVVGLNPGISHSVRLGSYAEFQSYLQQFSIYLYTIQMPYGDGFNLGLLEAMSMGMAVVTLYNSTSPICHEENGLVAATTKELETHLCRLLQDKELRLQLGEAAKKTVLHRFNRDLFIEKWNTVFNSVMRISN